MHSVVFKLGPITVHWFGVMMALAFLAGLWNWVWLGRRRGRDFTFCSDLLFWIMVSGVLGARVAYILANFGMFREAPRTVFYIHQGGLIFYGGIIGALAALAVFARLRSLSYLALIDFVATSVPLAHALGRVGCFLNGCCHGRPSGAFPGVCYPPESPPWWHQVQGGLIDMTAARTLAIHPVQLYESAFDLLLYLVLVHVYRRDRRDGLIVGLYLVAYPTARFAFEFLRGDPRAMAGPFTWAQAISLSLVVTGAIVLTRALRRGGEPAP